MGVAAFVLVAILLMVRYAKGFVANIAVLLGIIIGCLVALGLGKMSFDKVAKAPWVDVVTPFAFGMPSFDPLMILTMTLVMIVVMIESTGMFLALSEITGRKLDRRALCAGLRTDGLGTLIGGLFNTFPYTSFSQNVGLVGITGVRSRWVCVAEGLIMLVLGLLPKMAALVESIPGFVLGGAGLVMFGMVAATGVRILANVDFKTNRNNLYIVAISIGFGMIPLVAPRKRLVVAGPTLKFNLPAGFLDLSLLAGKEWNHCGLAFCTDHEHGFDAQWILSAAWGIPFQAGPVPLKFQGFINYNSEKGKDYSGVKTEAETLMRTSLIVDVGQMAAGRKNTLLLGVGYELWLNKFGNHTTAAGVTKPGINTYAPTLQVEWHF